VANPLPAIHERAYHEKAMSIYLLKSEIEMIFENTLMTRRRFFTSFSEDDESRWKSTMEKIEFCESMRAIKKQVGNSEADAAPAGWYPKQPQVYEALPAPDMELPDMAQNAIGNYYERDPDLLPDAWIAADTKGVWLGRPKIMTKLGSLGEIDRRLRHLESKISSKDGRK